MGTRGDRREVWVVYNRLSGSVLAVLRGEPVRDAFPPSKYGAVKASLSAAEIGKAHQLRVEGGRVVHAPSLAGI